MKGCAIRLRSLPRWAARSKSFTPSLYRPPSAIFSTYPRSASVCSRRKLRLLLSPARRLISLRLSSSESRNVSSTSKALATDSTRYLPSVIRGNFMRSRWPAGPVPPAPLESDLGSQFHRAIAANRVGDLTEIGGIEISVRLIELRSVGHAERFGAKLHAHALGERKLLEQRCIEIEETGPGECVPAHVSRHAR